MMNITMNIVTQCNKLSICQVLGLVLVVGLGLVPFVLGLVLGLENHVFDLGLVTLVLVNLTARDPTRLGQIR